eukprot:scaffold3433_cov199-Pinguiococcus_pyrenoidosus.AAC.1
MLTDCSLVADRQCETCPAGRYQDASNKNHCKLCPEGYYCPEGARAELQCGGASLYCEAGSDAPTEVSAGYYTMPTDGDVDTRVAQRPCEPGYRCVGGERIPCENGTVSSPAFDACIPCAPCGSGRYQNASCDEVGGGGAGGGGGGGGSFEDTCISCPAG